LRSSSVIVSSKGKKTENKTNKNQNQNKTKQNIPSSNAIQFHLILQHAALVQLLCHQRKRKRNNVWRQFCECLSEAVALLPPTVSQLLLEALLIADLMNELNTHLAPQAMFN
jgi:hypothetical protein